MRDLSKALPTLNRLKSLSMQMDWQSLGRILSACLVTSQRPCRHAPNIGVENGMKRTLVDGVVSEFCVFSSKISAKARPSDSQTTRCQEMERMVRRIYGSAGGDVLEMCWRWDLLDIGDVQIASILS